MFGTARAADMGALTSGALATISWAVQLNELLTLAATCVAIVAGLGAAAYHFEGWRARRAERLKRQGRR